MATARIINFGQIDEDRTPMPVAPIRDRRGRCKQMTPKQMRARIRRQRAGMRGDDFKKLYKPLAEWDSEELARGRPRDKNGKFGGKAPAWITRELHEEAMTRFRTAVRDDLNASAVTAMSTIQMLLTDDSEDEKGKKNVPPSVKADIAKWLAEQVVGKPKQHVQSDISVKLQAILASSVISPDTLPALPGAQMLTSPREALDVEGWEDEDE